MTDHIPTIHANGSSWYGAETQVKVLVGMQRRLQYGLSGSNSARYLGELFGLSQQSTAAALKLLEDKGLVSRATGLSGQTRWYLTTAGVNAEVK